MKLSKIFTIFVVFAFLLALVPGQVQQASAVSPDIVISQVYGGGGNTGAPAATLKNDFIELYNRGAAPVDITGWTVQYGSSGGSTWSNSTTLSGTIQPGHYYLIQEAAGSGGTTNLPTPDAIGSIAMSATSGKVALVNNTTALSGSCPTDIGIVDFVGYGSANCSETSPAPALNNVTAALRKSDGEQDTDNNSVDFVADVPNPRNSQYPNPSGSGSTGSAALLSPGDTVLLLVAVIPGQSPSSGFTVTCDLSTIGGSSMQAFYDDGTHGDVLANDSTFSYNATVAYVSGNIVTCTVSDSQGKSGSATILLNVILPIGIVQGSVSDTDNGATFASPYVNQTVFVQGVIYEKTQEYRSAGGAYYGFFLQNTADTIDDDPNSSDGIFIFHDRFPTLLVDGGGNYIPQVGDEVVLRGPVQERFNNTRLNNPRLVKVVQSGLDLEAEIPAFEVDPPSTVIDDENFDGIQDAYRYWERHEGMRAQVPANSIVLNGRNVFASTFDSEVWVARPDSLIAQRTADYERRSFRDVHPLDDIPTVGFDNENPYRILMGTFGVKAAMEDTTALLAPARTFDALTNAPIGGVYYNFGKYSIQVGEQIQLTPGVDPALDAPPQAFDRTQDYSIVDYNLENLYDYRDNPFSGCDFNGAGNDKCSKTGTPFLSDITPSYDYVPENDVVYQARLNDIALQIIDDLHSPDILMVQEVENQDICKITSGEMDCGKTDNVDGQPDDLQDLALEIASLGGPTYAAAFDRDSSDLRGIVPAFMYRTDRVQLLDPTGNPLLGGAPDINYAGDPVPANSDVSNPKTLNAELPAGIDACETTWVFPRAPDIGLFRIWRDGIGTSVFTDVYVINNHFKSGPDSCVEHRMEQAKYNAAIVAFLEDVNPDARIAVGGDLNVYPRPDDPFAPIGQPGSSDQLGALYDPSIGLQNLWEVLLAQAPEAAYSYVYQGQAQTLDQIFVNQPLLADLQEFRSAHINSDFPADYPGDVARGTSDHDPQAATLSTLPSIERLENLVMYYDANGMITGNNATKILLDRLDKAARFQEKGQLDAYRDQLLAFIDQINDFTPQFITQVAANSLIFETELLLSLP